MTAPWLAGALPRICASLQHTECLLVSHNNITLFGTMIKELQKLGGGQLEAYLAAGRDAGCPVEQMRNFAVAGVVLQPRQLRHRRRPGCVTRRMGRQRLPMAGPEVAGSRIGCSRKWGRMIVSVCRA